MIVLPVKILDTTLLGRIFNWRVVSWISRQFDTSVYDTTGLWKIPSTPPSPILGKWIERPAFSDKDHGKTRMETAHV